MTNKVTDRRDVGAFIPSYLDDFGLNVYEYRIYCRIVRRAGTRQGCFEAAKKMSESLGIDKKTVYKSLKTLTDHGLIEKQLVKGKSTHYYLTPSENWIPINRTTRPNPKTGQPDLTLKRVNGQPLNGSTHEPLTGQHLTLKRVTKVIPVIESIESNPMKEGNPPKPACSLDPSQDFARSVLTEVSPSPHPGYADRRNEKPDFDQDQKGRQGDGGECDQSGKLQKSQDRLRDSTDVSGDRRNPTEIQSDHQSPGGSTFSLCCLSGTQAVVDSMSRGQEFIATNQDPEISGFNNSGEMVKTQAFQNTEVEQSDVFNASARCDRQFMKLMPQCEFSKTEKKWLEGNDGQKLLQAMKAQDVDLSLWWKVLEYWQNAHQLWNWKGQEGFSNKTDVEKRFKTRVAFAGWFNKGDNANTFEAELECFKSGLRRADDSDRTEKHQQKKQDPTRRRRSPEEVAQLTANYVKALATK